MVVGVPDPPLRTWDLNGDSSRFDHNVAAPSDSTLHLIWASWSSAYFIMSVFNAVVLFGVLSSKKVRNKPFNLYLIYLMVPDVIFTFSCAIQCANLAGAGGYHHAWQCKLQSLYLVYGIAANAWLNGVITFELHKLLRQSNRRQHYFPPTRRQVTFRAMCVYLWALILALLGVVSIPWLPHKTEVQKGLVCLPGDYSKASAIFFWCFFFPCLVAIPLAHAMYVIFDIWRHKLLPNKGKARELSIYFFRLVVVFVVMWLPAVLVLYVLGQINPKVFYTSAGWAHAQGAVSAACSMMKPDIFEAVKKFIFCRGWWKYSPEEDDAVISSSASLRHEPKERRLSSLWLSLRGATSTELAGSVEFRKEEEDTGAIQQDEEAGTNTTNSERTDVHTFPTTDEPEQASLEKESDHANDPA